MKSPGWLERLWRALKDRRPASHRTGAWGEQTAARHLERQGYRILGRNVRFGARCELDLVARAPDSDCLVFVEVKTRRNEQFGRPADAVGQHKRRTLGRAARHYLRRLRPKPAHIRFDVIEVVGAPGDPHPVVRHIPNAFSPDDGYRVPW